MLCRAVFCCTPQSKAADEKMRTLEMTADDEEQLLREKPVLRQIFDAQVGRLGLCSCVTEDLMSLFVMHVLPMYLADVFCRCRHER
jgi:hypothetical protein